MVKMDSLEKKLKQIRIMKDVVLETDYVQLGKALKELGVVAQKIREEFDRLIRESYPTWRIKATKTNVLGLLVEEKGDVKRKP